MIKQKYIFLCVAIALLTRKDFCWSSAVSQNGKELLLSYMNTSVDPCNDFYEYACGNWKTSPHKPSNNFENDFVESILQRSDINDVAPEYAAEFEMAKQFYNNCMTAQLTPSRASSVYLKLLNKIGGFPAVDTNWSSTNFSWLQMSAHLSNYGAQNFVKEGIEMYYPFRATFPLPDFGFGINLQYNTINDNSSNAYIYNEKIMRKLLSIYGVKENDIDSIITEMFEFLKEVLKFLEEFKGDECEYLSGVEDISDIIEKWKLYNKIAWKRKGDYTHLCFYLYKKLDPIFENNKRAAANYLSLQFLYRMHGTPADSKSQKDICLPRIKTPMIHFFDHLFMKLHFTDELRNEISFIVKEIRQSLRTMIKEAKWLDETTRNTALLKESAVTVHIGRYEDTNYTKFLLGELKKLKFTNGSYEENYLNLCQFAQYMERIGALKYKKFKRLGYTTEVKLTLIGMTDNIITDTYSYKTYVMAGYLKPPAYNKAWPNSLKFGALGSMIAKHLMYMVIVQESDYKAKYLWSNTSLNAFNERAKCFVNHYEKYFIPEINRYINGELTKEDNMSYDGGLRAALMAYRHLALNKEEERLGTDFSPEQLFFLSFAQNFCSSYTKEDYLRLIDSENTIDKFRVLGALSNIADFAKANNCAVGSKMYPTSSECKIW